MKPPTTPQKTQSDRFIEAARALGCDEDEASFDENLKVIARHKPKTKSGKGTHEQSEEK